MTRPLVTTIAAITVAALAAPAAAADRSPNRAEALRIAQELRMAGYVGWDGIALNDGALHWQVDDARRADGSRWDLHLDAANFRIVHSGRDDRPEA